MNTIKQKILHTSIALSSSIALAVVADNAAAQELPAGSDAAVQAAGGVPTNPKAFEQLSAWVEQATSANGSIREAFEGIERLEQAAVLEPDYAATHALLAIEYQGVASVLGDADLVAEYSSRARDALAKALELGPDLPFVVITAAGFHLDNGEWQQAAVLFDRLIDGEDSVAMLVDPLDNYGRFLTSTGQLAKALRYYEQAVRGPFSVDVGWNKIQAAGALGDFGAAFAEADDGWQTRRNLPIAGLNVALAARDRARIATALERLAFTGPGDDLNARIGAMLDEPERALEVLRRELANAGTSPEPFVLNAISTWAAYFGDASLALEAVQQIRAPEKFELVPIAIWGPFSAQLRRAEEFKAVVADLGLVDYWRDRGWPEFCRAAGRQDFVCE